MKIGSREILFTQSFLIPEGEEAEAEISLPRGKPMRIRFVFDPEPREGKAGYTWQTEGEDNLNLQLTFFGKLSALGASTPKFQRMGSFDGRAMGFVAVFARYHSINVLHFQFQLEDAEHE